MSSAIIVSLRVGASPDRAFEVFTREIGLWWQPGDLFQFTEHSPGRMAMEPGLGGRLSEHHADGTSFVIGHITAWAPGQRLAFTWRQSSFAAGQETAVEVRFEAVGSETRVTVEHRGWDSVPDEHAARHRIPDGTFLKLHGDWWRVLLSGLAARLHAT